MSDASTAPDKPTRLLLTNLHPSVAVQHLRQHLSRCPPTTPAFTDLKVLTKPNGSSRCIAFAGFKAHEDAERVREWASGSWVTGDKGGTRIRLDWAKDARDAPPPTKRPRLAPSTTPAATDERFSEFMALMAPRRAPNKSGAGLDTATAVTASTTYHQPPLPEAEALVPVPTPAPSSAVGTGSAAAVEATHALAVDGAAEDEALTDAEYLTRRMKRLGPSEAQGDTEAPAEWVQGEGEGSTEVVAPAAVENGDDPVASPELDRVREALLETGRLFLRNLPFSTTSGELHTLFEPHGSLEHVHIPIDPTTKASKGMAYVAFVRPEDAVAAYDALDSTSFQGRLLHLLPAVGRAARPSVRSSTAPTLKEDRLELRKKNAGQSFSWGTLFLNADAAISAVADRLGVSKSALLDPSASDPAVKVALAEAHTLSEIRRYFEAEHVNLDALGRPGPRSSTCILVKNLPFGTTDSTLRSLFTPFGAIARLLVPPSGTIAIVEMGDAASTAAAWRGLAYKQIGGSVLYLEKAPVSIWSSSASAKAVDSNAQQDVPTVQATTQHGDDVDDAASAGATLFVKNLSFDTTVPRLKAAFDHLPDFSFARVQTKPDSRNPGKTLSMGFGFVGFRNIKAATVAKDARQGYVLDGHALELRFAQRNADRSTGKSADSRDKASSTTTKLLVKNVPFEATRTELRELFGAYGQLKSVRLPRKMDNKTRGFAFLDFGSRRDAEAAFTALEHVHLLGRHLVLQWATEADEEQSRGEGLLAISKKGSKRKFTME